MWDVIDDLMFEKENFSETVKYCKTHNRLIRDRSILEIEKMFWDRLKASVGSFETSDLVKIEEQMMPIFNACFIVSSTPERLTVPLEKTKTPGKHTITFFVRLGRKPAVDQVK